MKIKTKILEAVGAGAGVGVGVLSALERARSAGIRYYVLCAREKDFARWVSESGHNLQACKCVSLPEQCVGVGFSSPLVELIVIRGWDKKGGAKWVEEGSRLMARYCLEKRVHTCVYASLL